MNASVVMRPSKNQGEVRLVHHQIDAFRRAAEHLAHAKGLAHRDRRLSLAGKAKTLQSEARRWSSGECWFVNAGSAKTGRNVRIGTPMSDHGEASGRSVAAGSGLSAVARLTRRDSPQMAQVRWDLSGVAEELRADRWLYAGVAVYTALAGAMLFSIGDSVRFKPLMYVFGSLEGAVSLLSPGILIVIVATIGAVIEQPRAPLAAFRKRVVRFFEPRIVAGTVLFCAVAVLYGTYSSVKNTLPDIAPGFTWDVRLADVDRLLHGGYDPGTVLAQVTPLWVTRSVDFVYLYIWGLLLLGVTSWAAVTKRHRLRLQFFSTYVLCWALIGNVLAGLFLAGGPCYYAHMTGDGQRFAALMASVDGTIATAIQDYLWKLFTGEAPGFGSGISAFPSMHLSVATFVSLYLGATNRWLGVFGALFTATILFGSVRLGWHYAIDGYASIVITVLIWIAMGRVWGRYGAAAATRQHQRSLRRVP
jgi:hypothetical protein